MLILIWMEVYSKYKLFVYIYISDTLEINHLVVIEDAREGRGYVGKKREQ